MVAANAAAEERAVQWVAVAQSQIHAESYFSYFTKVLLKTTDKSLSNFNPD